MSLVSEMLRYWRARAALSQENLALRAGISPRHMSFLESGRSKPSEGMLLRLFEALDVPATARNEVLHAAGFAARFPQRTENDDTDAAIALILEQHEPFPLTVISPDATILHSNRAATRLFRAFVVDPAAMPAQLDMVALVFDPRLMRPFVVDWQSLASGMLRRMQRELITTNHPQLRTRIERALAYPGVPDAWHKPNLAEDTPATITVRLARDGNTVGFLVTVTTFVTAARTSDLRIETCYPLDEATRRFCNAAI